MSDNWDWNGTPVCPKCTEPKLIFEQVSFQEFQDIHNLDPFFYDFAGVLLTSYRAAYYHGPWIAGGFLTRALQGETGSNFRGDVDVWFNSNEQKEEFIADLDSDRFGLGAKRDMTVPSKYAYTYIIPYQGRDYRVQLISYKTFNSIEHIMSDFDLFSAMIGTDGINVFYETEKSRENAKKKVLEYNWKNMREGQFQSNALVIMRRHSKFIANSYTISGKELEKFVMLIKDLPMYGSDVGYH